MNDSIPYEWTGGIVRVKYNVASKGCNMQIVDVSKLGFEAASRQLRRTAFEHMPEKEAVVRDIVDDVRSRGDAALLELGRKFDSPELNSIEVTLAERGSNTLHEAIDLFNPLNLAASRIREYHERQKRGSWIRTEDGLVTGQTLRPMDRVGVYVPGGTALYPSTVLMCAIPAKVAGVREVIVCTPAGKDGKISPLVLLACQLAGVDRVFKVGGAQAVAAMAFGTETVPVVDKIVGPGNTYVNLAKRLVWGAVDIDMLAGPSEVCVVADDNANPVFIAADVLTQAEHDAESAAFVMVTSQGQADNVMAEVEAQLATQPRAEILKQALANSALVICKDTDEAIALANVCSPEHLALMVSDPMTHLHKVKNAGAVLLGDYTPQTLGDYMAGPSHTLPTSGAARFSSPVDVDMFYKKSSFIQCSREGLAELSSSLIALAEAEGFAAHAQAVRVRKGATE
jgi:histidinol dehydrogenase